MPLDMGVSAAGCPPTEQFHCMAQGGSTVRGRLHYAQALQKRNHKEISTFNNVLEMHYSYEKLM